MRKSFISTSAVLFAAAGTATPAATKTTPVTTPVAGVPATTEVKAKPEIVVIGVSTAVAMPTNRGAKRGNKAIYDLSRLEVGQSLAIKGRKAENLTSTISTANRNEEFATFKKNDAGEVLHAVTEVKDANGNVVGQAKGAKLVASRRVFFAYNCDPKTDPEGADVRIFRDADKTEK